MSQAKVDLIRRVFASITRGDLDAALEETDDDFELDYSNSIGPLKGVYRGREEVRKFWASFIDAFERLSWDAEEIIDVDELRVIVINHTRMRGRGSGVDVEAVGAQLWTISDGKARRMKLFQSKADALEAAGLSE